MKRRILAVLLACMVASGGVTGCSFTDGVKDGMEDAMNQDKDTEAAKTVSESKENVPETQENVSEETETASETPGNEQNTEKEVTGNPLLDAKLNVGDVMNGTKTEKLGEYAWIRVPLVDMKNVTMEQYDEFCKQVVHDSGYNWVSIEFGDGTGLQFAGSVPQISTYGTFDYERCIVDSYGTVMQTGDNTYEYTPSGENE